MIGADANVDFLPQQVVAEGKNHSGELLGG